MNFNQICISVYCEIRDCVIQYFGIYSGASLYVDGLFLDRLQKARRK